MSTPQGVVEFDPATFEQITVTTSATLLSALMTAGIPTGARHAVFHPEGDVRWRVDGTSPTSAVGIVMKSGQNEVMEQQPRIFETMQLIASANTLVNVHFFK